MSYPGELLVADPLWRWSELYEAVGLPPGPGPEITGISIDSRTIMPGELFIALTGDPGPRFNPGQRSNRDGHSFIEAALARGAAAVMSHDGAEHNCPVLSVPDTLDGLWALGRAARKRLRAPVVAITGSSGKTTTKSLLSAAMDAFSTAGSLNNHLGVPLSLARTPRDVRAAVYEIGTNHPGEIAPLAELVQPTLAIVLNVHPAHAENFADLAALRSEKLSIHRGLTANGVLVVEDQIELAGMPAGIRIRRFGKTSGSDVQLLGVTDGRATYRAGAGEFTAVVPGGGEHRALSLAAVLAALEALELELAPALGLGDALIPRGRGDRIEVAGVSLIDDSYNANPASMAAALGALARLPGRRFALLGEMLELGEGSADYHRALAPLVADLDGVYLVGAGMACLNEQLGTAARGYFESPGEGLLDLLAGDLRTGDILLIKGSNRVFWARGFVPQIQRRLDESN